MKSCLFDLEVNVPGKVSLYFFILLFLLGAGAPAAAELNENLKQGYGSIKPNDAYGYCKILSQPEFAGRLTGHRGYTAAAQWAGKRFKDWGLRPFDSETGYLQSYPSPYTVIEKGEMTLLFPKENREEVEEVALAPGSDFLPLLFSDSGDHTAPLAFVGWGIHAPDLGYDDYADVDVKGKFVLSFRGTPDGRAKEFMHHDHHRTRMKTAKEKGALGLIYIYPKVNANPNGEWLEGFTPAMISDAIADRIFQQRGVTSADLREELKSSLKPFSFTLDAKARFLVESNHVPDGIGYNVVGMVEGSDPDLKRECVVIGGHLDHCGDHMGLLFAGANDNASGSAAVMEVAEAFSMLKCAPRRTVVFVLFGGEEMGLLGSNYFANHIPSCLKKMSGMINLDMVGEGDGTGAVHSPEPPELKAAIEKANGTVQTVKRYHTIKGIGVRSSDYAPFFKKEVPCIAFFSNGPHVHYHETRDTIYRVNPDMLADAARITFLTAWYWADR